MIIPIWQEIGQSTHQLAAAYSRLCNEPVTHTGTLDPLARGVVVLLTGEDRFKKGAETAWNKTYEFSILWGVQTDSDDQLGLIQHLGCIPTVAQVTTVLADFPTTYEQELHPFSARRFQGKSSFEWAKAGVELPVKVRTVTLEHLSITGSSELSATQVLLEHEALIKQISGDFRQETVIASWQCLQQHDSFFITHHSVQVSTGTYIRQLVHDLAAACGFPATTYAITRTKNGLYQKESCQSDLQETFREKH